ncbi:3-hydroxyacyl-CoA dehydrogenase NAD-binding domain-containing protein [Shinella curvata]|uniref:3-hydroxyacyl-CoA dehydrogenase NAD-binding domain-containing protein n=1 Tax=Shinella curvata TaxID=1817964 RepID=A0ABT8XMQ6_9HYPH|nr:3-hydroxyacyl-CoA dehydrogenase NAD-binding domain-containing protein [Shinella curvata]MCJ8056684.1 3-hydroxyacyl-CoA dehydrogenase NAD-binding domain-containing protein [Shinella curvata]MDO6124476.1 3-hydroxyacyl-CoA dehydrogenase NAD-binding domain-containing protein [Shinella curvata]
MTEFKQTAVLGAGVIGASWTALFLASGRDVAVYDNSPTVEKTVRDYVARAWPTLESLGLVKGGDPDRIRFCTSAAEAVEGASFVQENVPERIGIKHALYKEIEPSLGKDAVVATSASGLTLSEMQEGWQDPGRFVLGHPFNPPHLIPLVEVMGNERTADGVVEAAERFYEAVGKVTIRVNREVPGHVANRLQAAVWREAIHLVKSGVASVEDVDKAMWAGPGLRWAAMGPTMLFHLGAGEGGLAAFCERYTDSFNRWWDDLGVLHLDPALAETLVAGVKEEANGQSPADLSAHRDALIASIQKAMAPLRTN